MSHVTLDREESKHTRRLRQSMNRVRWSKALMQLFWTAVPVTGLGLMGGYYIGYGQMPPIELILYFISFTIFSGLIGLIAKVVYDSTYGHLQETGQRDVLSVTNTLGDLILAVRDLQVQSYEGEAREREAALQMLQRVDLSPYGVSIAYTNLTGDPETGRIMAQIYAYRRAGLHTRVKDIYNDYKDYITNSIQELENSSPEAAEMLKMRFSGNIGGSLKKGVRREPYFLQRIMSAIENNNPLLMTLLDVEEMLILAFELINEREIPTLIFSYSGKWKFAHTLDQLEKRRSNFRVAQARGGNRMRALAAYYRETGIPDDEELPKGLSMNEMLERIIALTDRLQQRIADDLKQKPAKPTEAFRNNVAILETALELYRMGYEGYREIGKRHAQLREASKAWERLTESAVGNPGNLRVGAGKRGLRIRENIFSLNDDNRLEFCRHMAWYMEKEGFADGSTYWIQQDQDQFEVRTDKIRRLAIEIALSLEPHIKLTKPEIQRNITATKAIYLGELSPDMSAVQKQDLGRRMAKEVTDDLSQQAEQLAEALVHLYHVDLHEKARDFLSFTYGADPEKLKSLDASQAQSNTKGNTVNDIPPVVIPVKQEWKKTLTSAQKYLRTIRNKD